MDLELGQDLSIMTFKEHCVHVRDYTQFSMWMLSSHGQQVLLPVAPAPPLFSKPPASCLPYGK